jgi:hypothetical protein
MNNRIENYMCAILSNPEWMKQVAQRYGQHESVGAPEIATAVRNLENSLREKLDVDEDTDSSEQ